MWIRRLVGLPSAAFSPVTVIMPLLSSIRQPASFFSFCAALARFRIKHAIAGFVVVILAAITVNIVRIIILAIGIAYPETYGGLDVMAQPWHDLIGLFALATGAMPIIFWTHRFYRPALYKNAVLDQARWCVPKNLKKDGWWLVSQKTKKPSHVRAMMDPFRPMAA